MVNLKPLVVFEKTRKKKSFVFFLAPLSTVQKCNQRY